jgi:hypothetical protein
VPINARPPRRSRGTPCRQACGQLVTADLDSQRAVSDAESTSRVSERAEHLPNAGISVCTSAACRLGGERDRAETPVLSRELLAAEMVQERVGYVMVDLSRFGDSLGIPRPRLGGPLRGKSRSRRVTCHPTPMERCRPPAGLHDARWPPAVLPLGPRASPPSSPVRRPRDQGIALAPGQSGLMTRCRGTGQLTRWLRVSGRIDRRSKIWGRCDPGKGEIGRAGTRQRVSSRSRPRRDRHPRMESRDCRLASATPMMTMAVPAMIRRSTLSPRKAAPSVTPTIGST